MTSVEFHFRFQSRIGEGVVNCAIDDQYEVSTYQFFARATFLRPFTIFSL